MKNKHLLKTVSLITGTALMICMLSTTVYADSKSTKEQKQVSQISAEDICKDETVYVISKADGDVDKIIVNDWMKSAKDNGDEDSQSQDMYYEREMSKKLPVDMTVSYKLDGNKISPEDLAGKSGKVTIRFDFKNNQTVTANIDGKSSKIYVPFTAISCVLLDNDDFSNIEVSNGKLINDGEHTVVAGFAFPGMNYNLKLDGDKLDLPDFVEITADTENFSLDGTYTAVTCELFNDFDLSEVTDLGDLDDMMSEVTKAMDSLVDGTTQLSDGLATLEEKSGELFAGVDKLQAGANAVADGSSALAENMNKAQAGAAQVAAGLNTIDENSAALNAGAKQVFESLLATANSQLAAAGMQGITLTTENYAQVLEGVLQQLPQGSDPYNSIYALKAQLDAYNQFYAGLLQYTGGVSQAKAGANQVADALPQLTEGAGKLQAGAASLSQGMDQLKKGADALQDGISQLKDGSLELSEGVKDFTDEGMGKLTQAFTGDLSELTDRIKAVVDAGKAYKNYSGLENTMEGSTRFIYKTAAIEVEEQK